MGYHGANNDETRAVNGLKLDPLASANVVLVQTYSRLVQDFKTPKAAINLCSLKLASLTTKQNKDI